MPHRIEFYQIMFITKGLGKHYIDFRPYKYKAGSILFISKGQVHTFEVSSDIDGFLILFTDAFLSKNLIHSDMLSYYRLYNYHLHSPCKSVTGNTAKVFIDKFLILEIKRRLAISGGVPISLTSCRVAQ